MTNNNYPESEIISDFISASNLITDDCTMAGAEILACEILGVSTDRLYELVEEYKKEKEDINMSETVKIWVEEFKANDTNIEIEIKSVKGNILNEQLWVKGSTNAEETEMHLQNIGELEEYLEWLEEQR